MRVASTALALAGLIFVLTGCSSDSKPTATSAVPPVQEELGVERLAQDPAAFAGRALELRGVVSFASVQERRFVVIDEAEYRSCRELSCSAYEIPVAFVGALPETAQFVRIVGRLAQPEPGRYLVQADSVQVLQ